MRLWILSDLHVDQTDFVLPATPPGAEVLVVAGDVDEGMPLAVDDLQRWSRERRLPVVFVPGNHDLSGGELAIDPSLVASAARLGVHVLDGRHFVVLAGVRFVGATLWTDFEAFRDVERAMETAKAFMPEFSEVMHDGDPIPTDLLAEHVQQRAAIDRILSLPFDGSTVVVTHHAPHPLSLPRGRAVYANDAAFASDLMDMIERRRPALWVHGHVHAARDHHVGATRIVCNPRGYRNETGIMFRPDLVVDEPGPSVSGGETQGDHHR